MKDPKTVPWGISISNADLNKLKAGLEPQNQDHKWRIWLSDENEDGSTSITIARTAFRRELYIFHVKTAEDSNSSIETFTWEQSLGRGPLISEELAKQQAIYLCRKVMHCDMEALSDHDDSATWRNPAFKHGIE